MPENEEDDGLTIDGVRMEQGDRIIIDPEDPPSWFSSIPFSSIPFADDQANAVYQIIQEGMWANLDHDILYGEPIEMEEGKDGVWRQK